MWSSKAWVPSEKVKSTVVTVWPRNGCNNVKTIQLLVCVELYRLYIYYSCKKLSCKKGVAFKTLGEK